jgi:putative addiction module killer protein
LHRLELGNFGDSKSIKGSSEIRELRIDHGPGYRIYFALEKLVVVVLFIGGNKNSQKRDIEKAKRYWIDYKEKL